jgi:hypothetical protein
MQRIDETDVLLLYIARGRVRNERSAAAVRRNGKYVREIESFILETLGLIKGIFVILLKVGAGRVGANTHYRLALVIGTKVLPHPRPATSTGRVSAKLPSLILDKQ